MRIKNKLKDSDAISKEWWEVAKELEKNMAQHRVDGRIVRYKLKVYQRNILDFVSGSATSIKALG
jgi:hypothetical protein